MRNPALLLPELSWNVPAFVMSTCPTAANIHGSGSGSTAGRSSLCRAPPATGAFKPDPVDEAAARREGTVTWYTASPIAAAQHIADEFHKQTGIKVEMLRASGQTVIRRFMEEAAAGRIYTDVLTMSDMSAANALTRRGMFVPFKPVAFDKVFAEVKDPNGYYIAQRLTLVGIVARTDRVASVDLPRTWTDLLHPKYKGLMVMADPSFASLQLMLVATLSQKLGLAEELEGRLARGEEIDVERHALLCSTLTRLAQRIGIDRRAKNITPSLGDYLRSPPPTEIEEATE